jgi:hypothetical protein
MNSIDRHGMNDYAIFTSPNQFLLDRGIGLVVFGADCRSVFVMISFKLSYSNYFDCHSYHVYQWNSFKKIIIKNRKAPAEGEIFLYKKGSN